MSKSWFGIGGIRRINPVVVSIQSQNILYIIIMDDDATTEGHALIFELTESKAK